LHSAGASLGVGLDAAQCADHRDLLAALTIDGALRAAVCRFVGQLFGVTLFRVFCQPLGEAAQNSIGRGHDTPDTSLCVCTRNGRPVGTVAPRKPGVAMQAVSGAGQDRGMVVDLRGARAVLLPGTGSDDDFVRRAFSDALRDAGASVIAVTP